MATIDEINKLKEKLAELEREFATATGTREEELETTISLYEKQIALMEKQSDQLDKQLAVEKELVKQGKGREELIRLEIIANNRLIDTMKQAAIESGAMSSNMQDQIDKIQKANEYLEAEREIVRDINNSLEAQNKSALKLVASMSLFKDKTSKAVDRMQALGHAGKNFGDLLDPDGSRRGAIGGAFSSLIAQQTGAVKEMILAFDESTKSFERQFAVGERYKLQIQDTYYDLNELGATMENVTDATGRLITNFTDFTFVNDAQQRSLEQTAVLLERNYGITDEFSKGMQVATKAMGMTVPEAENLHLELVAVADALELTPQAALAAFESLGPKVAKYGADLGKNFKEIMRLSKLTGMEMGKIINVADGFDTFESAAERTGMLNAALGGNFVNAMDMMMETDPSKRFMMISDAINQTGLSFQEMGYYQKQFFAEAAGLDDVNDLALIMSGRMDLMAGATNASAEEILEQKERARDLMTIMEQLKAIFVENGESIVKFAGGLAEVVKTIEGFVASLKRFSGILIPLTAIAVFYKFAKFLAGPFMGILKFQGAQKARNNAKEIAANNTMIGQESTRLRIIQQQITAQRGRGFGVMRTPGSPGGAPRAPTPTPGAGPAAASGIAAMKPGAIMALAVPLLALGVGLGAAAFGFSYLADSMAKMNIQQMVGLAVIVGGLSLLFFKFSVALMTMAPAAEVASLPLLKLGGAIALLGLGIGLAAAGIGAMAMGFKGLDATQVLGVAMALIAMAGALVLIFKVGIPGLAVMKGLTLALLGMGVAALAVGVGISLAAEGIKDLSADQLYGLAAASVAFGLGLKAIAAGAALLANPASLVGLAALTVAGAALMGVGAALGVFKKEKEATKELAPALSAFGGVSKAQFEAAEKAFASMETSLSGMSSFKLIAMGGALRAMADMSVKMSAPPPAASRTAAVQAPAATGGRANRNTKETLEVKLKFENPFTGKFQSEVIDIVRDEVDSEVTYALQYGTSPQ